MTSIFPGGNAFKAADITNKQHNQSAEMMEKISVGKRVTNGADDAANLFNINNLQANVLSTKASIRNVTDLMSAAQIADKTYGNITGILQRANEIAVQATNSIYKDADRLALNNEIQNLINEVDNISNGVTFASNSLINGINKHIDTSFGSTRNGSVSMDINQINSSTLGVYEHTTKNYSNSLKIETFNGTDHDNFLYEDVTSNSLRALDLGSAKIPSVGNAFFSNSYIDFIFDDASLNNETTKFKTVGTASHVLNDVSVVGSDVFVGNGTSADVIGTIDATFDGTNGNKLRINIAEPSFTNGDFESATDLEGWSLSTSRAFLDGSFTIDGKSTPLDTTYPAPNVAKGITDKDILIDEGTLSGGIETVEVASGSKAVVMTSQDLEDTSGHSVVRGPYLYSNSTVHLGTSSTVSFSWKAEGGDDAYNVYAYLVNVDDPSKTVKLLDDNPTTHTSTSYARETVNITEEGTYQFVFVAGSYDATGGHILGAQLYIDDISVTNAARKLSGEVIENIGTLLYGEVDTIANNGLSSASSALLTEKTIDRGQEIEILGPWSKKKINVKKGEVAETIAKKIDKISGITGVEATSSTQAMLSFENSSDSTVEDFITFNLYGIDGTRKQINTKVDFGSGVQNMDLKPLRTEINKFADQTGVTAYLTDDSQAILLKTKQGFDIIIEDFNLREDTSNVSMYINEMKSSGEISPISLKIDQTSSAVGATDSARIFGEVVLKSHKHFNVKSAEAISILSLREKDLSFRSLSSMSTRSFEAAKNSLDIIKFSLKTLSSEQSKAAGLANQLQETVHNLSKSKVIGQMIVGKLEDLDVPKTVVSLQKSNYIQSIASAMVSRVKSTMEAVLQMLDR